MITPVTSESTSLKQKVIGYIWPIATSFFMIYTPLEFFVFKDYLGGGILLANFLFFIVTIFSYFKTKNAWLVGNALGFIGIPVILPWLISGGPGGVGFWWSLVYVIWAFIVTDKKMAFLFLSIHIALSAMIVILSRNGILKIAYSLPVLLNLLFAYAVTILYTYFLVSVIDYYLQLAEKRAEKLLNANNELVAANKELEQFAYVASHDLQEPLRTISSFVSLIARKDHNKTNEDTEMYFQRIVIATNRMQNLIKDLLEFSRAGKNITYSQVDCNKVLDGVSDQLSATIKETGAQIKYSKLPVLTANEIELNRLFQNLISNAIKFRKKTVVPEISITAEESPTEYLFAVKDNGIGIEEKYFNNLFILFQRLHSASEYPGTGLGLATCKKVVEMHNGKIWLTSKVDEGSTFFFTISKQPKKNPVVPDVPQDHREP